MKEKTKERTNKQKKEQKQDCKKTNTIHWCSLKRVKQFHIVLPRVITDRHDSGYLEKKDFKGELWCKHLLDLWFLMKNSLSRSLKVFSFT